jgi:hypothetical protein
MKKVALAYANGLRASLGLPPLNELPKGKNPCYDEGGVECPLNRAVPGFYISTLRAGPSSSSSTFGGYPIHDSFTDVPEKVSAFIRKYDSGGYPELIEDA